MVSNTARGRRLNAAETAELIGVTTTTLKKWRQEENPPPYDAVSGTYDMKTLGIWMRTELIFKTTRGGAYGFFPDKDRCRKLLSMSAPALALPGLEPSVEDRAPLTKQEEETRLAKLKADKLEIELAETAGALVKSEDVTTAWVDILSRVKAKLTRIPSALAPLVHGNDTVFEVQETLEDGVREALEELSDDWREVAEGEDDD